LNVIRRLREGVPKAPDCQAQRFTEASL